MPEPVVDLDVLADDEPAATEAARRMFLTRSMSS